MLKRFYLSNILLFISSFFLTIMAQNVRVVAPSSVAVDEYFELKYIIENADVDDIVLPTLKDFDKLSGPNTSRSSSFQFINGKSSHTSSVTFTYILQPKAQGKFTIPGAQLSVDGKEVTTRSVELLVTEASGKNRTQSQSRGRQQSQVIPIREISEKDLFVKVTPSRIKVFEQEAVELVYSVYAKIGVGLSQIALAKTPDFKNLLAHDLQVGDANVRIDEVNGETYKVSDCLRYVVFPQQSGEITISPLTFECQVVQNDPTMDLMDAFFNGGMISKVFKRSTRPLKLQVASLPEPKPTDFCGGVGNLSVQAELLTPNLRTNEMATFRLTFSGTGNLKLLLAPTLQFPTDFDTYEVKTTEELQLTSTGHAGKVVYDYNFVPTNIGNYSLPALTVSYFDTQIRDFKTLNLSQVDLRVKQGVQSSAEIERQKNMRAADIRSIHQGEVELQNVDDIIKWGTLNYWLLHIILLAIAWSIIYFGKKRLNSSDGVVRAKRKAAKVLNKRMAKVKLALQKQDSEAFYRELHIALHGYISDKFGLTNSVINKDAIYDKLISEKVSSEVAQTFVNIIEECEFARYAPNNDDAKCQSVMEQVFEVIRQIENVRSN